MGSMARHGQAMAGPCTCAPYRGKHLTKNRTLEKRVQSVCFWLFFGNEKDAWRPYDHFGDGIAPRSLLCVRKRRFPFWGAHVLSGSDFLNTISQIVC